MVMFYSQWSCYIVNGHVIQPIAMLWSRYGNVIVKLWSCYGHVTVMLRSCFGILMLSNGHLYRLLEAESLLGEAETILKLEHPTSPYGHLTETILRYTNKYFQWLILMDDLLKTLWPILTFFFFLFFFFF